MILSCRWMSIQKQLIRRSVKRGIPVIPTRRDIESDPRGPQI